MMLGTEQLIRQLKYYEEKHKNDVLPTGGTNVSALCYEVAQHLAQLLMCKDYIKKIDAEVDRLYQWVEKNISGNACVISETEGRIKAFLDVAADLKHILKEEEN